MVKFEKMAEKDVRIKKMEAQIFLFEKKVQKPLELRK